MINIGRPVRLALLVSVAGLCGGIGRAQTTDTGIDINLSAEASKNPYLTDVSSEWVGAGSVEARPWLRHSDAKDSVTLRGLARVRGFTSRYDPETAFGADLQANSRLSARTSAFGSASILTTNRRTPFDVLTPRPGLTDPVVPPETTGPIVDPIVPLPGEYDALLGSQGRITTMTVGAGVSHQLDVSSSLGYNIDYRRLDSESSRDLQTVGYDSVSVGANYSRVISPRTRAGVAASAGTTRYDGNRPSATTFSLSGTLSQQLSRYWALSGSLGVSSTRAENNGFFPGYSSVAPVGSISVCNQPVRKNFCFSYSRSQQPTFLGDVRTSDAVSASYSEQLSNRQRADLSASYSRSKTADDAQTLYPDVEGLSLRGVFSQSINDRLEGYVSASVAKSYGGYLSRDPSINFGVGVRLRLGVRR